MSRLEQITPEEMPEVVRIASRIRDEEQEQADRNQEQKAFVDAAAEMDLPQEYLERAAGELHQAQAVRAQRRSRTGRIALAASIVLVATAAIWAVMHTPPHQPNVYQFSASFWKLNLNPKTAATVTFKDLDGRTGAAVIHVDKFVPRSTDGQYFVNLDATPTVSSFSHFRTTSFFIEGAGLANIRLYLEASGTERWRSPPVPISESWQQQNIDLSQYQHQSRETPSSPWHDAGANEQPGHIDKLSFKVGSYMNDVNASGDVAIDDLEIR